MSAMGALLTDLTERGWQPPADDDADAVDYPDMSRELLDDIEDASPWFGVRNQVIDTLLERVGRPEALVEVGAGNGTVAAHLRATGIDVIAVEPSAIGAANCTRRGLDTIARALEDLHLPDACLPAIGVFDVIEHLEHPEPLLREAHRVLRPGGLLVVTVPALPLLWSQVDEYSGHHVRYRRATLDRLVTPVGFRREACSYFFALGIPFALVHRAVPYRLGHRRTDTDIALGAIDELNPSGRFAPVVIRLGGAIEAALIARRIRLPAGTSLGAVYRKAP